FDLTPIPTTAVRVTAAVISVYQTGTIGSPYNTTTGLGTVNVAHVFYGATIDATDYALAAQTTFAPTPLSPASAIAGLKTASISTKVGDDLANRSARANRSQFRLQFSSATNSNAIADYAI